MDPKMMSFDFYRQEKGSLMLPFNITIQRLF